MKNKNDLKNNKNTESDVTRALGFEPSRGRPKRLRLWLVIFMLVVAAVTTGFLLKERSTTPSIQFKTQETVNGDLTVIVTATGSLEPTNQVDVGSELSGIIRTVEVDYNDRVKVGGVLAKLDTSKLEAQVLQSRAALASAKAKVLQAEATVREAHSNLTRLKTVRELSQNKVGSQVDLDAAEAAVDRALADKAGAEADVAKAQATLGANKTDLAKAVIRSPINGIVLVRNVEPGQTVAASLQAPVLFTLAEDLTQMELHVDVDEADVGQVEAGQDATFSVDAYPDRNFQARITQVRYGAETTDNVVTYETVLKLDNRDLSLRPGMTATADITVNKVEEALLIPNAALRFSPPEQKKPRFRKASLLSSLLPQRPGRQGPQRRTVGGDQKGQRVWTLRDGDLTPIQVTTGATDGTMTVVTGGNLVVGTLLVVN